MFSNCGEWFYDEETPEESKCDHDRIAEYILFELKYQPRTTIEEVVNKLVFFYYEEISEKGYFAIEENPNPNNINIDDIIEYADASGGIEEFDYWEIG